MSYVDFLVPGYVATIVLFTGGGIAVAVRLTGSADGGLEALGLCLLYGLAFTIVFIVLGLVAPNRQAAQGMSMVAFVLAFISSTYVLVSTMPGWMQSFAKYQPVTPMVDAMRAVLAGHTTDVTLALVWTAALVAVFTPLAVALYRRS